MSLTVNCFRKRGSKYSYRYDLDVNLKQYFLINITSTCLVRFFRTDGDKAAVPVIFPSTYMISQRNIFTSWTQVLWDTSAPFPHSSDRFASISSLGKSVFLIVNLWSKRTHAFGVGFLPQVSLSRDSSKTISKAQAHCRRIEVLMPTAYQWPQEIYTIPGILASLFLAGFTWNTILTQIYY